MPKQLPEVKIDFANGGDFNNYSGLIVTYRDGSRRLVKTMQVGQFRLESIHYRISIDLAEASTIDNGFVPVRLSPELEHVNKALLEMSFFDSQFQLLTQTYFEEISRANQ